MKPGKRQVPCFPNAACPEGDFLITVWPRCPTGCSPINPLLFLYPHCWFSSRNSNKPYFPTIPFLLTFLVHGEMNEFRVRVSEIIDSFLVRGVVRMWVKWHIFNVYTLATCYFCFTVFFWRKSVFEKTKAHALTKKIVLKNNHLAKPKIPGEWHFVSTSNCVKK